MLKTHGAAASLIQHAIMRTGRTSALEHLKTIIRDLNPYLVREPDICTVYTEMAGKTEGKRPLVP